MTIELITHHPKASLLLAIPCPDQVPTGSKQHRALIDGLVVHFAIWTYGVWDLHPNKSDGSTYTIIWYFMQLPMII